MNFFGHRRWHNFSQRLFEFFKNFFTRLHLKLTENTETTSNNTMVVLFTYNTMYGTRYESNQLLTRPTNVLKWTKSRFNCIFQWNPKNMNGFSKRTHKSMQNQQLFRKINLLNGSHTKTLPGLLTCLTELGAVLTMHDVDRQWTIPFFVCYKRGLHPYTTTFYFKMTWQGKKSQIAAIEIKKFHNFMQEMNEFRNKRIRELSKNVEGFIWSQKIGGLGIFFIENQRDNVWRIFFAPIFGLIFHRIFCLIFMWHRYKSVLYLCLTRNNICVEETYELSN